MNKLSCGAASVIITPPENLLPNLYGLANTRFSGIHDDLHIRVLALSSGAQKALIVCFELDKALNPAENIPLLSRRTGIPEDAILYTAVHTHTAPLHGERPNEGPNRKARKPQALREAADAYEAFVTEKLLEAVDAALASLRPATIGWETGCSYINENRVMDQFLEQPDGSLRREATLGANPAGSADPTVFVLRAADLDGNPIAFLINYAVHCCVMLKNNHDGLGGVGISADIAGQVSTMVERKYPGSVALWTSGAAGDLNPRMLNQFFVCDHDTGKSYEIRDVKSDETARLMLAMMSSRHFQDIVSVIRRLTSKKTSVGLSAASRWVEVPARNVIDQGRDLPPVYAYGNGVPPYRLKLRLIQIGELVLCGVSGELFQSLGQAIQEACPGKTIVVINHDASLAAESGYIFDDETLRRCERPDGSLSGLPDIRTTRILPGYLSAALRRAVSEMLETEGE